MIYSSYILFLMAREIATIRNKTANAMTSKMLRDAVIAIIRISLKVQNLPEGNRAAL